MNEEDAYNSCKLRDMAIISAGHSFRGSIDALPKGDVAVIQLRDADPDNGIDWDNLSRINLQKAAYLRVGDIILSTRGGRYFAYHIDNERELMVCSPHFFVLRLEGAMLLPEFLVWQINQKPAQDYFVARATGSYILNLKRSAVEGLPITVPPLAQQRRIAALDVAAKAERLIFSHLIQNRATEMAAIARDLLISAPSSSEQKCYER